MEEGCGAPPTGARAPRDVVTVAVLVRVPRLLVLVLVTVFSRVRGGIMK